MARLYIILLVLLFPLLASASKGKVFLNNGKTITGDLTKRDDGSCLVVVRTGSVTFDKNEIKKIVIYSVRDVATERFVCTLKTTQGQKPTASCAPVSPYDTLIDRSAHKNHLDPALLKAVMKAESNFNPRDQSSKGACGLMQLMPETAKILGVKDIYSPEENVAGGAKFLGAMLDQFGGDTTKALAAYNAGPIAVQHYNGTPPYAETKNYVKNVYAYYKKYRGIDGDLHSYTDETGCLNIYNVR